MSKVEIKPVPITLNDFGPYIEFKEVDTLLQTDGSDPKNDVEFGRYLLDRFFGVSINELRRDILERYVELCIKETYLNLSIGDGKLYENIMLPLKNAKRSYCHADYFATIETCTHLAEMLAVYLLSSRKDKLAADRDSQETRINNLLKYHLITEEQKEKLTYLRKAHAAPYHRWSFDSKKLKNLAYECFTQTQWLVKNTLKIDVQQGRLIADHKMLGQIQRGILDL